MPRISGLYVYPVKSLRGFAVPAVDLDELGFAGDRRFLVVDDAGIPRTQRELPAMARIETHLGGGTLTLSTAGAGSITVTVATDPNAPLRTVSVWKSTGLQAEDCGAAANAWLSSFLGVSCHLVRIGAKFVRPVLKAAGRPGDRFSFADGAPILAASEASLSALNDRILEGGGEPIPMDRFRPNLVISDCDAFAEDTWAALRIGTVVLRQAGRSDRCIMTTTDQRTGERPSKEPLKTLATFRRGANDPSQVFFGANLINESKGGTIRVGDTIQPVA